ncbi:transposon-transfer assisting family protein [Blautia marasmi]|uniref:transposon-transfer assisting family protein n=1 Tax=Blautia marasmi TaxID=1917868 RepID=UPI000CF2D3D5|nr:transposon-transfer assisting family protein [Blautia marasmi]
MNALTFEEQNLLCIYSPGTREGAISALTEMRTELAKDETELLALTDSALEKLRSMSDAEFHELELFPDFDE